MYEAVQSHLESSMIDSDASNKRQDMVRDWSSVRSTGFKLCSNMDDIGGKPEGKPMLPLEKIAFAANEVSKVCSNLEDANGSPVEETFHQSRSRLQRLKALRSMTGKRIADSSWA